MACEECADEIRNAQLVGAAIGAVLSAVVVYFVLRRFVHANE